MPPLSSRMTKNRAQPTRYRPGKVEAEEPDSEEESSEEDDDDERRAQKKQPPPSATSFPSQKKLAVDLSKAGEQTSVASKLPRLQKDDDALEGFVTASESSEEGSGDSNDESEEDSSGEEESSSEDELKKPMLRPMFVRKANRAQTTTNERNIEDKAAEEERLRKEKADDLLRTQLERDAASKAAGKKYWDDEDVNEDDEIDDTDGLDLEAEMAAWKLRELKRVRRDRLAIEEKEKEREEIERRRNMTVEEREKEDQKYIQAQKEERDGKGKMGYMQKYFHKGAFFNDAGEQDEEIKNALNRDFAGARFADDAGDKAVLPEYMRIRDMTRLGKKGRTRYKDLKSEDTGRWGQAGGQKRDYDGVDDRFRPDHPGDGGTERTGANMAPVGERRRRDDDDDRNRDKRARYE